MRDRKKIILTFLVISGILLSWTGLAAGESSVEINPEKPKPGGEVTFTATINNVENIEKVVIVVEECGNEPGFGYVCYTDGFNETMSATDNDTYTATVTLKHKNTIELKYRLGYLTGNGWEWEPPSDENMVKVELDTSSGSTNDNDKGSESPGFEIIFLVLSTIFILLILYRRKR